MQDSRTMMTTATSTTAVYNSSSNNEIVTMIMVQCYDIYPSIPRDLARLCPIYLFQYGCTVYPTETYRPPGHVCVFYRPGPQTIPFQKVALPVNCTVSIRNLGEFAKQFSQRMWGGGWLVKCLKSRGTVPLVSLTITKIYTQ